MRNKDLERIEYKIDEIFCLIVLIGSCLFSLFLILFIIMFVSDLMNDRYLESLLSFTASFGSFIILLKISKLFDMRIKKLKN